VGQNTPLQTIGSTHVSAILVRIW